MRRIINTGLKNIFASLIWCLMLVACSSPSGTTYDAAESVVPVRRLDLALASYPRLDRQGRDSVLTEYAPAIDFLFGIMNRPVTDSSLVAYAGSRAVRVFEPDIVRQLPSLYEVESTLGHMAERMQPYSRLSMPVLYGIVSPYNQRVFSSDSLMLVGLNHYLGPEYEGYSSFPKYLRDQKQIQRLPIDVAEALIASAYPMTAAADHDLTALAHMLYQGGVLAVELNIIPDASEASVIGYTPEQWDWAIQHEAELWQALIRGDYIYNVSPSVADRLVADAPSSSFLMPGAPGRIGRFIGLRIVQSYIRRNPDTDMEFILSPDFYGNISTLAQSGYSPR